jgi:hypothetical protein
MHASAFRDETVGEMKDDHRNSRSFEPHHSEANFEYTLFAED